MIDVVAASSAAKHAEEALARGDLESAKSEGALAASLAREPFLPGDDAAWVEEKRRELSGVRARSLSVVADACLEAGEPDEAATWAEQAIALDPFRESGYRRLMEAHVAAGNRAEALRVYERCRRRSQRARRLSVARDRGDLPRTARRAVRSENRRSSPELPRAAAAAESRRRVRLAVVGTLAFAGVVVIAVAVASSLSTRSSPGASALASSGANAMAVIDSASGRPSGSVPLEASPTAIAYGQRSVWVTMVSQDAVSRIDPETETIRQTIATGNGPDGIAVGGGFVGSRNSLDGTVWQIDPQKNGGQVVAKIRVGNGPTGITYGLGGVCRELDRPDGGPNRSADRQAGKPVPVDVGADARRRRRCGLVTSKSAGVLLAGRSKLGGVIPINVGNDPSRWPSVRGAVWVANNQDATVWRIDPAKNRVVGTVTVGEGPSGVSVGRRHERLGLECTLGHAVEDRPGDRQGRRERPGWRRAPGSRGRRAGGVRRRAGGGRRCASRRHCDRRGCESADRLRGRHRQRARPCVGVCGRRPPHGDERRARGLRQVRRG